MRFVEKIEAGIIWVLIVMLLVSVVLGVVEMGRQLIQTALEPPYLLIEPQSLFISFGTFLVILIGLELLKLLKLRLSHQNLRPAVVIEVAIIAVCNKIVTLDIYQLGEATLGLAALLLALSAGYYVFMKMRSEEDS